MMDNLLRAFANTSERLLSTRTNYWAEFFLDAALATVLIGAGVARREGRVWPILLAAALGLLLYSFIEYVFHRWLFHTRLPLFGRGHRLHHEHPEAYDSLPFFLPALISLGLAGLCVLIMPTAFALVMIGTVTVGYILYGLSHFAIHHLRFRQPLLRRWAASHHIHHHHPGRNFGVTTPLWDFLLGTHYVRERDAAAAGSGSGLRPS